jgi:hypothetical protein
VQVRLELQRAAPLWGLGLKSSSTYLEFNLVEIDQLIDLNVNFANISCFNTLEFKIFSHDLDFGVSNLSFFNGFIYLSILW